MKTIHSVSWAILIFLLAIELSFVHSVIMNSFVCLTALVVLIYKKRYKSSIALLLIPFIPAIGTYWSLFLRAQNQEMANVLFTRTYAFASMGVVFLFVISVEEVLLYLEQKGLAPNFVYGLLVVVHALPSIKREIQSIKEASLLREKKLHMWSPSFYAKAIMTGFEWRDQYVHAMYAHGYREGGKRTQYCQYKISIQSMILSVSYFILVHVIGWLGTL